MSEEQQLPTYEEALRHVDLLPGQAVLDVGCGVGVFLELVAARGARAFGIDASEGLLDLARERVPEAELSLGDMESLPYADDTFDLVTGFNSFFFATDMLAALREAGRVAKPDAPVVVQVWGPHERNDLEAMKNLARPFLPPRPADAPPEPDYAEPGVLERLALQAGLSPHDSFDCAWAYEFRDAETLGRALLAPAGLALLAGPERELALRDALVEGLTAHRAEDGVYRLSNEFHYLIARV